MQARCTKEAVLWSRISMSSLRHATTALPRRRRGQRSQYTTIRIRARPHTNQPAGLKPGCAGEHGASKKPSDSRRSTASLKLSSGSETALMTRSAIPENTIIRRKTCTRTNHAAGLRPRSAGAHSASQEPEDGRRFQQLRYGTRQPT